MRKLLLLVPFLFLCLSSFTQTNIQQDNRVSPVLKRAASPQSGYSTYGRTGRFINMAVINQSTHIISWFTCHGRFFDSTSLDDQEYEQLATKQLNPFELYQHICDKYLADIAAAKDLYRAYGDKQLFDRLGGNYRALFAMESVQAAKTPLQKLMAIENVRKKILTQLAWLNCANPASLQNDPLYRINKEQAGIMVQTKDSTVYYNIDPTSAVAKICLYKRSPEKLYVQNRQSEIIDSISIQSEKYELLQKEKTDVFLLYRGWLEMQWQDAMGADKINPVKYQEVNIRQASYRQLNAIRAKINLLISPEAKCIEQVVYDTYKSETSEIYYIPLLGISYNLVQTRGLKEYELTNHLGNVLVTISDRKNGVPSSTNSSLIDHYEPDIVSAQDYYPFGMLQPGRSLNTGEKYRYGFNGKENDNEVKGEGNQQDYGMRMYDPRLGKFLSVDPVAKEYPWNSPYSYAEGDVIRSIDLDGLEKFVVSTIHDKYGRGTRATVQGVSTIESSGAINAINMQLNRANGVPLTSQDVYDIHERAGMIIADRQRSGGLTNTETNALRKASDDGDRIDNFNEEYGTSAEEQELARAFPLRVGEAASVIKGSSPDTHKYFDAHIRYPQSAPATLSQNLGGSNYYSGVMSSGSNGISLGSGNGINTASVSNSVMNNINSAVSAFISNNRLNIAFVDNITLTIGDNTYRAQWNIIQNNLQRTYNTTVNIVVDPLIEGKNAGYANPASVTTSAGYLGTSVNMSGVTNGTLNYAAPGARTR